MKRVYMTPEMQEIAIEMEKMLCLSGDIIDDATEPALAPFITEPTLTPDLEN